MKKILKLVLPFVIIVLCASVCAFAADAEYELDVENGSFGDIVTVSVSIVDSPGFGGIAYDVLYDSDVLKVDNVSTDLGGEIGTHSGDRLDGRINFQYAGISNVEGDGVLAEIEFEIISDAEEKTTVTVVPERGSSFYYGGDDGHEEFDFTLSGDEKTIVIYGGTKGNGDDDPVDDEDDENNEDVKDDKDDKDDEVEDEPEKDDEDSYNDASNENVDDESDEEDKEPVAEEKEDTVPEDSEKNEPVQEWKNPFSDVSENDWFYDAVRKAYDDGIMNGVSEDEFGPSTPLTRAMFVTILYRIEESPKAGEPAFDDVDGGAWYSKAVAWASENGIVNGVSENTFSPNANITREQLATIMFRYAVYGGLSAVTLEENLGFDDAKDISSYAIPALNWAVGAKIITGKTASTLEPLANATRAETCVIISRFLELNL